MRKTTLWNDGWKFVRENIGFDANALMKYEDVQLPHTWNAVDGQDGGNDYYRGTCWYTKQFKKADLTEQGLKEGEEAWLQFDGAAMTAEVYLNGQKLGRHEGGYSTFRVNLTDALKEDNLLAVSVDNSENDRVYPQKADFTFYGGIYRDVKLLIVEQDHFTLDWHGSDGIQVTPYLLDENGDVIEASGHGDNKNKRAVSADIEMKAWVTAPDGSIVTFVISGEDGNRMMSCEVEDGVAETTIHMDSIHLWDGVRDPYLYDVSAALTTATGDLENAGQVADSVYTRIGLRTFSVDPDEGFFLNGRHYPLCGVSRHQDRKGVGNALTPEMHKEDLDMILDLGANTIRLAHYQHAQYFYDLCDEAGLIVWAEIPYISKSMPTGRQNTIDQLTDLIAQNYHHASIVTWSLSNEITVDGGVTDDLVENHRILNDLAHQMDDTRLTTMAEVFILDTNDPIVELPDIRSYNLYYGWYVGEVQENGPWFDKFHKEHPHTVIGLSEYGADATLQYQTGTPKKGDYTEEYQAYYHENMLAMWQKRPFIWAMHVWNMFDFGADGREDGGEKGFNHKGLVSADRNVKKDAFYIYKAYLSNDPFVHLCGSRYIDRPEEKTEVKVYSNLPEVTLYMDGKEVATKQADEGNAHVFTFTDLPITGEHIFEAKAAVTEIHPAVETRDQEITTGEVTDSMTIRHVDQPNPNYVLQDTGVTNWFDQGNDWERTGFYSIMDPVGEIAQTQEGRAIMAEMQDLIVAKYGDVARGASINQSPEQKAAMAAMPLAKQLQMMAGVIPAEKVKEFNDRLNQVRKG